MDWTKFSNHGESNNHAFEVMCNLLFESWCRESYEDQLVQFVFVNGAGGDGGVESYGVLANGNIIGVQSKWFPEKIEDGQIRQISNSFKTAIKVRPNITKYIVCIPRDLGSKKMVKGGVVARNTEYERWEQMVLNYKSSNPNVEIILWDETILQERLTKPETQGIYKYWFENTIIFDELFKQSYEKTVNGWAKLKYIPEIHATGYIHNQLERFLGSIEITKYRFEEICKFIHRLKALLRAYEDLLELGIPETTKELKVKIEKDLPIIKRWIDVLESNKTTIKDGGRIRNITESLELSCSVHDIKDSPLHFGKYFHFSEAEKLLDGIEDDFFNLRCTLEDCDSNKIIFLGMQGTGKTAGMIAEASLFLQKGIHLPVIIHAKEYYEGETWASIIIKTLGLSYEWNEIELLGALQNAALIRKKNNIEFSVEPQCVIFVDGIDEAISWKFWKERIEETTAFKSKFPRIKFVFLSRPYVFEERYKLSYKERFYSLPITGDGELEEICDKYFKAYRIDIGENLWIKKNLKTPVSIKLFCDIYRNKKIKILAQNTVVLTELYKAKIESLEEIYSANHSSFRGLKVIQTALIELAQLFAKNSSIQYQDIYDKVSVQLKNSLNEILDFLINEGFIYTYIKQEDDFSLPETYYSWGMQPAFDYLIAQRMYKDLISGRKFEINHTDGIYQMLSLITIENGKLITEYTNVKIENQEAFKLICYALANCSIGVAEKYTEYLKKMMRYSVAEFREIFSNVIQLVLRSNKHPLGSVLLDEFLREFDNPAERDIWWSIPTYLRDNYNADWRAYTEIDFENINLDTTDKYRAAPLALAWSLSSVNNSVRQSSRYKLTTWGIAQPLEFWKLFEKCASINDMQVLEDIFAIAYGIALEQYICEDYLATASKWFIENIFSETGLKKFENVTLRYYGSGIVKIAITKGLLDEGIKELITPPYNYEVECLPLCKDALNAGRMGGYEVIDYDLARYVLCDRLDNYFRIDYNTKEYSIEANTFIEKYKSTYELSKFKIDGFIIALAYQYLLNQGWNSEKFLEYKDKERLGVDIAIRSTFYPATHGEMSHVMTVAEKNVWLAKHQIEAVFANEIPLKEDDESFEYVDDYSQLENFINTYQDYINTLNRNEQHFWFNADLLAVPTFEKINKDDIEKWMKEANVPMFDRWLSEYDGNVVLNTYTNVQNNISGVSESVWISSGAVKKSDFSVFLASMDTYFEDRNEMLNVSKFCSHQDCQCYCTPQEACLVHSNREINSYIKIPHLDGEIRVHKLVEECLSADEVETERFFTLPSRFVRLLTNIVYGDGYSYSDNEGNIIAKYSKAGENWGTYQKILLINNDLLIKRLNKQDYKLFWLFRIYREPSPKARERYAEIMHSTDRTYIIWKEGELFKFKELLSIQPIRNSERIKENFDINAILQEYGILDE